MTSAHSRRSFLRTCAWATALTAFDRPAAMMRGSASQEVLREFAYRDVRLTAGPLKEQYDAIRAHYLSLDNDRLLKVYRQHAGLPAPGKDMGGWYDADGFVPGHSLGQYISGLARIGSCSGDQACHLKVRRLLEGFAAALEANPNPYAGPNAEKVWPAYVMDKHAIGLIDAYRLSGVEQARALLPRMIEGALPFISPVSRDRVGKKDPPYDETYVLPENLFTVHELTGERRFHELAMRYLLDREYFDPLSRGEDVLPGRHAYSHALALSSAASAYLHLGDPKHRAALVNAWRFLEWQRYASGGFGPDEQFVEPHTGALYESLARTKDHFETPCGSYAGTKLARYLLRLTGEARYGDGLERLVYNALLAVKHPDDDGDYPYYSTYGRHAVKEFYPHKWPCCSGTLVQGVADHVLNLYFQAADGVCVNLFAPSEVVWSGGGTPVRLEQETQYPDGETTTLRVDCAAPATFAVHLRVPGWLRESPEIAVNGRTLRVKADPGSFAAVRRTWNRGDRLEMRLPLSFRLEPIDELHPRMAARLRGPVLYASLDSGRSVPFYTVRDQSYSVYLQQS